MRCLILSLLLTFSFYGIGQGFLYLEDIKLRKDSDFIENERTVIKAVDYLMSSPIDEKNFDRKLCTRFIIKYAQKSPFITMTIDGSLMKVYDSNPDLLQMYIGLWLKSAINNKNKSDLFHEEYIYTEIFEYCSQGNGIVKTEIVESLIQAGVDDAILNWIRELKK